MVVADKTKRKVEEPAPKQDAKKLKPGDGQGEAKQAVPSNALPAASGQAPPSKPCRPGSVEEAGFDCIGYMRCVISWVHYFGPQIIHESSDPLLASFKGVTKMEDILPLKIENKDNETALLSYKAPWDEALARSALESTDLYEAAISLFWLALFAASASDEKLSGDLLLYPDLVRAKEFFFTVPGKTSGCISLKTDRIIFPIEVPCHSDAKDTFFKASFTQSLKPVSGHLYLFALYDALYDKLESRSFREIALLMQTALTITGRAHVGARLSPCTLALQESESRRTNAKLLSFTFVAFSDLLVEEIKNVSPGINRINQEKYLEAKNIRWKGVFVKKQVILAAEMVTHLAPSNRKLLRDLDSMFGQDVYSNDFFKLYRTIQMVNNEPQMKNCDKIDPTIGLEFLFKAAKFVFQHELLAKKDFSANFLFPKETGKAGWALLTISKLEIVMLVQAMVEPHRKLVPVPALVAEVDSICSWFKDHEQFGIHFPAATREASEGLDESEDPYQKKKDNLSKAGQTLLNLLYDLFSGVFDDAVKTCRSGQKDAFSFDRLQDGGGDLAASAKEVANVLSIHHQAVSITAQNAVMASAAPSLGEAEDRDDSESKMLWGKALEARKTYNTLVHPARWSVVEIKKTLEKLSKIKKFEGGVGKSHIAYVFAADQILPKDEGATPWFTEFSWTGDHDVALTVLLDGSLSLSCAIRFAFDGRSKAARRKIDTAFESTPNVVEGEIVFAGGQAHGRKVAFASRTLELFQVALPVERTKYPSYPREDGFGPAGMTIHNTVYERVPMRQMAAMQTITLHDKQVMCGMTAAPAPGNSCWFFDSSHGVPLLWDERKPVELWRPLIKNFRGKLIVNLSPGTGQLEQACMMEGIECISICKNAEHVSWLDNCLARQALRCLCSKGCPLHSPSLADAIKKIFSAELEVLNASDKAKDPEEGESS